MATRWRRSSYGTRSCQQRQSTEHAAELPGSFDCCAPTALFVLGANFAVAIVALVPFVVPAAVLLLMAGLLWSARRLEQIASEELAPIR